MARLSHPSVMRCIVICLIAISVILSTIKNPASLAAAQTTPPVVGISSAEVHMVDAFINAPSQEEGREIMSHTKMGHDPDGKMIIVDEEGRPFTGIIPDYNTGQVKVNGTIFHSAKRAQFDHLTSEAAKALEISIKSHLHGTVPDGTFSAAVATIRDNFRSDVNDNIVPHSTVPKTEKVRFVNTASRMGLSAALHDATARLSSKGQNQKLVDEASAYVIGILMTLPYPQQPARIR